MSFCLPEICLWVSGKKSQGIVVTQIGNIVWDPFPSFTVIGASCIKWTYVWENTTYGTTKGRGEGQILINRP